jgi:hypothetical protein
MIRHGRLDIIKEIRVLANFTVLHKDILQALDLLRFPVGG